MTTGNTLKIKTEKIKNNNKNKVELFVVVSGVYKLNQED